MSLFSQEILMKISFFQTRTGNTFLSISCFETRTRNRKSFLKVEREKIKLILTGIPGNWNSRHSLSQASTKPLYFHDSSNFLLVPHLCGPNFKVSFWYPAISTIPPPHHHHYHFNHNKHIWYVGSVFDIWSSVFDILDGLFSFGNVVFRRSVYDAFGILNDVFGILDGVKLHGNVFSKTLPKHRIIEEKVRWCFRF